MDHGQIASAGWWPPAPARRRGHVGHAFLRTVRALFARARESANRHAADAGASDGLDGTSTAASRAERAAAALDAHGDSVLRFAYSYLHNLPDAEDVLQETLVRYLAKAPAFADAGHERAWLLTVAGNLAKSRLRKVRAHRVDELREDLVAEGSEDLAFVWDAVRELPENQRAAVHLFYEEGYPTAQVARILGRGESTVRSDLTRARAKLKAILRERYDFDG